VQDGVEWPESEFVDVSEFTYERVKNEEDKQEMDGPLRLRNSREYFPE